MATKSRIGVEVKDTETEIIESTHTSKETDRKFGVGNGEKEITATAWGSDDNQNWEIEESKTIPPYGYKTLVVGNNHLPYVKLSGKTTNVGDTCIVDAYLNYNEPEQNP
jgi:hypothetical protein